MKKQEAKVKITLNKNVAIIVAILRLKVSASPAKVKLIETSGRKKKIFLPKYKYREYITTSPTRLPAVIHPFALEKILPKRYENIAKGTIKSILNAVKNHSLEKVNASTLNWSVNPISKR